MRELPGVEWGLESGIPATSTSARGKDVGLLFFRSYVVQVFCELLTHALEAPSSDLAFRHFDLSFCDLENLSTFFH